MAKQPKCPICRDPVDGRADNDFFPFCSRRCKAEDLGKWLDEDYRMSMGPHSTERSLEQSGPTASDDGQS